MWWKTLIALLWVSSVANASINANLYSENSYLSGNELASHSLRVRVGGVAAAWEVRPYFQLGQELISTQGKLATIDTLSSFAYLGPGLSLSVGRLTLYGETRFRKYYADSATDTPGLGMVDARALLVYGDFFSHRLSPSLRLDAIAEVYSESVLTSADSFNVVLADFVRIGTRWGALPHLALDLFVEPFITLDRIRHFYYNRADLKACLRLVYFSADFSIGGTASYVWNQYFSRGDREPNPYLQTANGIRMLLTVGATL